MPVSEPGNDTHSSLKVYVSAHMDTKPKCTDTHLSLEGGYPVQWLDKLRCMHQPSRLSIVDVYLNVMQFPTVSTEVTVKSSIASLFTLQQSIQSIHGKFICNNESAGTLVAYLYLKLVHMYSWQLAHT